MYTSIDSKIVAFTSQNDNLFGVFSIFVFFFFWNSIDDCQERSRGEREEKKTNKNQNNARIAITEKVWKLLCVYPREQKPLWCHAYGFIVNVSRSFNSKSIYMNWNQLYQFALFFLGLFQLDFECISFSCIESVNGWYKTTKAIYKKNKNRIASFFSALRFWEKVSVENKQTIAAEHSMETEPQMPKYISFLLNKLCIFQATKKTDTSEEKCAADVLLSIGNISMWWRKNTHKTIKIWSARKRTIKRIKVASISLQFHFGGCLFVYHFSLLTFLFLLSFREEHTNPTISFFQHRNLVHNFSTEFSEFFLTLVIYQKVKRYFKILLNKIADSPQRACAIVAV